jgi:hypothetical protein
MLARADTNVGGRFCVKRCGPSRRRGAKRISGSEKFRSSARKDLEKRNKQHCPELLRWIPRCWNYATTENAEQRVGGDGGVKLIGHLGSKLARRG